MSRLPMIYITQHGYRLLMARNKLGDYLQGKVGTEIGQKVTDKIMYLNRRIGTFALY